MAENANIKWSGKTGGQKWMQTSLIFMFKCINIRILYGIMSIIIIFYMIFSRESYKAIYYLFRERFGYSPFKSFCNVYLNHYKFGQIILDRFAFYAGKRFDITIDGYEHFLNLRDGDDGFIILSSHVGNYELAGYHLTSEKKSFHALAFGGETETVMKNRNKMFCRNNIKMIVVKGDMSHLFEINNALSEGNIVSIPADRILGSTKFIDINFLGKNAKFPMGPFATAVQREIPAISIFVMKESVKKYSIYVKKIDVPSVGNRSEKVQSMASSFTSELEKILKQYPTQWFNYYNFWE